MRNYTPVPNALFDTYLYHLTPAELKVLLIVIRQTWGWSQGASKKRKKRDRILHSQFMQKTGLCRKVVSKAIQSLIDIELLRATAFDGSLLNTATKRKGKQHIFYELTLPEHVHEKTQACVPNDLGPVYEMAYNKRNYTKENELEIKQVGKILTELYGEHFQ